MGDASARDTRGETGAAKPETTDGPTGGPSRGPPIPIPQLVQVLAAVAGAFYVVGFLTSNAYLYQLGVSDFSLLRTRFVLTGVLVVAPLTLAFVGGVFAALDIAVFVGEERRFKRTHLWVVADILVPFLVFFVLFFWDSGRDVAGALVDAFLLSLLCSVVVLVVLAFLAVHRRSASRPVKSIFYRGEHAGYERFSARFGIPEEAVEHLVVLVGGMVLFLAYVGLFGQLFYPQIPEQLGGGRPRTAQLLVAADALPVARRLGLDVTETDLLSPPVHLLWEGEQTYVIRLPSPHDRAVVQIDRGFVVGIVTGEVILPAGAGTWSDRGS